jgi:hypothetical protein
MFVLKLLDIIIRREQHGSKYAGNNKGAIKRIENEIGRELLKEIGEGLTALIALGQVHAQLQKCAQVVTTHNEGENKNGGVVTQLNHLVTKAIFDGFKKVSHK